MEPSCANHIPNKKWATLSTLAGQSSYGVYLFHNAVPIIFAGIAISATQRFVLFSLVTVLLAIVLNRLYEGPLHRYGIELANRISGIQKTKS
jgi:peptidoglycan/LPS O-acetylase OafA/YrhL